MDFAMKFLLATIFINGYLCSPLQLLEGDIDASPLWHDDDRRRSIEEIVHSRGYPFESHEVVTEDGYILTMHRIPYGKDGPSHNRDTVFLQHGLLVSSVDWVLPVTEKSLAFMLADRGYDVWLGNARGNKYSRKHVSLDPDEDASTFWDFSWDEIGAYDISAMIDYALALTKQKQIFHIGHSQGTTTFYTMATLRPEYNKKIRAHFSLSPVVFMGNLFSPMLRLAAAVDSELHNFLTLVGIYEFLPPNELITNIAGIFCSDDAKIQPLCYNALFLLCGFSNDQMNATMIPVMTAHTPAGASTKQVVHYGQLINSGRFRRWDYGLIENIKKYGSPSPPDYDISKVTSPVYLFYSRNDWMAAESDVLKLVKRLPNLQGKFLNPDPKWNHLDFTYGIDANKYIYNQVISLMTRH